MTRTDLATLGLAAALLAAFVAPLGLAVVDDTYIHYQYARNLANGAGFVFNPGERAYGATSPLWVFILALAGALGGDIELWSRILAAAFALASVAAVHRLALAVGGGRGAAAAAALVLAGEAWLARWTGVCMETPLAVFTVILALLAAASSTRSGARSALFGTALFLAFLARPEALLLAPAAFAAGLWITRSRQARYLWIAALVPLLVAWFAVIRHETGSFLPLTAGAKQGRVVLSLEILSRALVPAKIMGATMLLPWIAVVAGVAMGVRRRLSLIAWFEPERSPSEPSPDEPSLPRPQTAGPRFALLMMLLWAVGLPAAYVIVDFQVLSRYLVPVAPAVAVLGAVSLVRFSNVAFRGAPLRRIAIVAFVVLTVAQSAAVHAAVIVRPTREFARSLREVLVGMGEWLRDNSEADAIVATPDIGAVAFVSGRRVLDLGGLVTPEINRMRRSRDVEEIIAEGLYLDLAPGFLLDRSAVPGRFSDKVIRGVRFTPVRQGTMSNLGIRKPEPVIYTLYLLERIPAADAAGD